MSQKRTRIEDQLRSEQTLDGWTPRRGPQRPGRLEIAIVPERQPLDGEIAARIESAYQDARFVIDSSFFDDCLDRRIWQALVSRRSRVLILPQVRREITGWLDKNPDHPATVAVLGGDSAVEICDFEGWSEDDIRTLLYYVNLLGLRKQIYRMVEIELESTLGRLPTASEVARAKQEVGNKLGVRASLIARKGARANNGSDTFYTDEALTTTAFLTAIYESRTTVILTRDEDIFDQFYKLQWLLDIHYRGMLFAEEYVTPCHDVGSLRCQVVSPGATHLRMGQIVSSLDRKLTYRQSFLPALARSESSAGLFDLLSRGCHSRPTTRCEDY